MSPTCMWEQLQKQLLMCRPFYQSFTYFWTINFNFFDFSIPLDSPLNTARSDTSKTKACSPNATKSYSCFYSGTQMKKLDWQDRGTHIDAEKLRHLKLADDIVILTDNAEELKRMMQNLAVEGRKCGIKMNTTKTISDVRSNKSQWTGES